MVRSSFVILRNVNERSLVLLVEIHGLIPVCFCCGCVEDGLYIFSARFLSSFLEAKDREFFPASLPWGRGGTRRVVCFSGECGLLVEFDMPPACSLALSSRTNVSDNVLE